MEDPDIPPTQPSGLLVPPPKIPPTALAIATFTAAASASTSALASAAPDPVARFIANAGPRRIDSRRRGRRRSWFERSVISAARRQLGPAPLSSHARAGLEIFLAHPGGPFWAKRDNGAWTIPKGVVDEGEELLDAARREFR